MMDGNDLMSQAAALPTLAARALAVAPDMEGQASSVGPERGAMPIAAPPAMPIAAPIAAMTESAPIEQSASISAERGASTFDAAGFLSELRANQLAGERAFLQRAQGFQPEVAPDAPPTAALEMPRMIEEFAPTPATVMPAVMPVEMPAAIAAIAPPANPANPTNIEAAKAHAVAEAPAAPAKHAVLLEKNLIFSLGNVRYAVPMNHIIEIAELEHYTPVPNVPDFILGLTNLRGDILSLVDLNALQGENLEEIPRGSNLLVTSTEAGDLTTCLVVDRVHGVATVNPEQIQHFDKMTNNGLASFTRGYVSEGANLLCLIDLESLLRSLELHH